MKYINILRNALIYELKKHGTLVGYSSKLHPKGELVIKYNVGNPFTPPGNPGSATVVHIIDLKT